MSYSPAAFVGTGRGLLSTISVDKMSLGTEKIAGRDVPECVFVIVRETKVNSGRAVRNICMLQDWNGRLAGRKAF